MKPWLKRALIASLAAVVLIGSCAWVYFGHGDWLYSVECALQRTEELSWTRLIHTGVTEHWTLEELAKNERVRMDQTLILVNASHPLPNGYEALLEDYNGARMHPDMVAPYIELRDTVQAQTGVRIYVSSDYRTAEEQAQILLESEVGIAAEVGCSEHEAGLALDVYAPYYAGENFLKSPAGREVNRICAEFGFIIRYPKEKEEITGISYEPWHLRYVGAPHAELMTESGLVLEEYIEALEIGEWYRYGDYLIGRCSEDAMELPIGWSSCHVSPDHCGNYIFTLKMR